MNLPKRVKLVEVGPRDGLQNEPEWVPTEVKIEFIHRLSASGLTTIEATSFVSHQKIPQLADASDLMANLERKEGITYPVLVPNDEGMRTAIAAGATTVAIFGAASETFSQKNINCSISESLERFESIMKLAKQHNIAVRAYISS